MLLLSVCLSVVTIHCIFGHANAYAYKSFTPCSNDDDCIGLQNATCKGDVCICNGSRFCPEEVTIPTVTKIGGKCHSTKECLPQHSECGPDNFCTCREGYVEVPSGKKCVMISGGIGSSCAEDVQCYKKTAHTQCRGNKCDCQEHMHHNNGTCYNNVALFQPCINHLECSLTPSSACIDCKCSCLDGHTPNSDATKCLPIAPAVGAPCEDDVQCTATLGAPSQCHQGTCRCKEMYQVKHSIGKCVRDMLLGDNCIEDTDCHEPFQENITRLECILGVCKCRSTYVEVHGFCINSSRSAASSMILCIVLSLFFFL